MTGTISIISPPRHPQFINVLSIMLRITDKTAKHQLNLTCLEKTKLDIIFRLLLSVSFYYVVVIVAYIYIHTYTSTLLFNLKSPYPIKEISLCLA